MKLRAPMQLGFDREPKLPETPERTMPVDAFASFVPALEFAARLAREKAAFQKRAFLPTDMGVTLQFARQLEALAAHLDVRPRARARR